jgi:hypothetical protein
VKPRSQRPQGKGELLRRLGRVATLDEAEEVGVLREIRLELAKTGAGPILKPRLGDVVLDAMEPALTHCGHDRHEPGQWLWAVRLNFADART